MKLFSGAIGDNNNLASQDAAQVAGSSIWLIDLQIKNAYTGLGCYPVGALLLSHMGKPSCFPNTMMSLLLRFYIAL